MHISTYIGAVTIGQCCVHIPWTHFGLDVMASWVENKKIFIQRRDVIVDLILFAPICQTFVNRHKNCKNFFKSVR